MLTSLLVNLDKSRKIEIHVLANTIPDVDRRKIEMSLLRNRPDFDLGSLYWLSPNLESIHELHVDGWVDIQTYARLLAPHVLPEDLEKVLYLDSDMVILSDISPLYDMTCGNRAVLAARDSGIKCVSSPSGVFNYAELGIPPDAPYFNAGVLLINLRLWREQHIADKILYYLKLHGAAVRFWDQGGLNAILYNSWTEIDPAWNQIRPDHQFHLPTELNYPAFGWLKPKDSPHIAHYTGADKPWSVDRQPGYSYFFDYLDRTVYRTAFKRSRLEKIIGYRLNYALDRLKVLLFWRRTPQDILRIIKRILFPGKVS